MGVIDIIKYSDSHKFYDKSTKKVKDEIKELLIGKRFRMLEIVETFYMSLNTRPHINSLFVISKCDCGNLFVSKYSELKKRIYTNCGCKRKLTSYNIENISHHPLYSRSIKIIERCSNPKANNYKNYGGRCIKCLLGDTPGEVVLSLLKVPGYKPGLQIDRIDNDGDYTLYHPVYKNEIWIDNYGHECLGNLRWVTRSFNNLNKRTTANIYGATKSFYLTNFKRLLLVRNKYFGESLTLENFKKVQDLENPNKYYFYYIGD